MKSTFVFFIFSFNRKPSRALTKLRDKTKRFMSIYKNEPNKSFHRTKRHTSLGWGCGPSSSSSWTRIGAGALSSRVALVLTFRSLRRWRFGYLREEASCFISEWRGKWQVSALRGRNEGFKDDIWDEFRTTRLMQDK